MKQDIRRALSSDSAESGLYPLSSRGGVFPAGDHHRIGAGSSSGDLHGAGTARI